MKEKYFMKTGWGGCNCYIYKGGKHKKARRYKRYYSGSRSDSDYSDSGSHSGSYSDSSSDSHSDYSGGGKKQKCSIMFTAIGFR